MHLPQAPQHRMDRRHGWLATAPAHLRTLLIALTLATATACGGDDTKSGDVSGGADAAVADTGNQDAGAKPSCVGIAENNRQLFAQYDDQCAFLADCKASGQCYCGEGCEAAGSAPLCADSVCADVDATCSCGDGCATDGSVVVCPKYVCTPLGEIKGCEAQKGCRYLDKERADKCTCTAMPDTEPNCFCGDVCSADKTKCSADKCTGKNPDKCIIVPGKKWTKPYCARCGLFAGNPRCFFVISPE